MNEISKLVGSNYNKNYILNKVKEKFGYDYLELADIFYKGYMILNYIENKYINKEYRLDVY